MNPKTILTEEGWDEVAPDCKGKDKELRRALLFYWSLEDDDFDFRCKALSKIAALAGALKGANEVKAERDAVKHLTDVMGASKEKQSELAKARAEAEKALKAKAEAEKKAIASAEKKAGAEAKKREQEEQEEQDEAQESKGDEDEDESGDSFEKLKRLLQTLKTSKVPYYFLACDAKPYGLVIAKRNIKSSAQHKKELAKVAGGSTRPPKFGTCIREGNKLIFEMEKPAPGLARVLQKWLKVNLSIPFKVTVGGESADDEEGEQPPAKAKTPEARAGAAPKAGRRTPEEQEAPEAAETEEPATEEEKARPAAASRPGRPTLDRAPEAWQQTQRDISVGVEQLKTAIRREFAEEAPDLIAEIDQKLEKLDGILDNLDDKLSESMRKANAAANPAARANELKNTKTILAKYIGYVKSEPLIAGIDSNPFGVQINLKKKLTDSLTKMAQAIGR